MSADLCFVAMPFGVKDNAGRTVDFDQVYAQLIAPAVSGAGLQPLRADQEEVGGIIHKPMFERLLLCRYAVVDLTFANANVFYELGVRHAARPASTLLIVADEVRLPFDVALLRTMPYRLTKEGTPSKPAEDATTLRKLLQACVRAQGTDSPVYQLVDGIAPPSVPSDKTDVFRSLVAYATEKKEALADARARGKAGKADLDGIRASLGALHGAESGVLIDLMLSYRAVSDWAAMASLIAEMPETLRLTVMVQEQLAFALNRLGRRQEAKETLLALIKARGPSSETLGILGRVYKDLWDEAKNAGEKFKASGYLGQAIDAYRRGFEADWRDQYPGINAVTLMEMTDPPDSAQAQLLPVVRYAVERRLSSGKSDYWDVATLLELAILADDRPGAHAALGRSLAMVREAWEPETTARNLRLIREARTRRGVVVDWIGEIEQELEREVARRQG